MNGGKAVLTGGTGGSITLLAGSGGAGASSVSAGTGGTINITGGNSWGGPNSFGFNDGYSSFPITQTKKPVDVLLEEIKGSLLGELDGYYNALENKTEITKNYDELLAKAEYNSMLFAAAAEAIRQKTEKLKTKANQFLIEELDIKR